MTELRLVPPSDGREAPPSASALIAALSDALRGRQVPTRRMLASGEAASPEEGLCLVQGFLAVRDPRVRQAILDAVATLAGRP